MRWEVFIIKHVYFSLACAINLGSSVILTGGVHSRTTVTEYNAMGFVRDLPPLQVKRYSHGCSYYENEDGTKVYEG